jgi:hypothetical protein
MIVSDGESENDSQINYGSNPRSKKNRTPGGLDKNDNSKKVPKTTSKNNLVLHDSRKWEDDRERADLKRGAFEPEETELLMNSLCQYCFENDLGETELLQLVSQKNEEHKGAWSKISSVLPKRSVQSCHNHSRRKFNPFNYQGSWTEEDISLVLEYVKKYG